MTLDTAEKFLVKANKVRLERKNPPTIASVSVQSQLLNSLICSALARLRKLMPVYFFLLSYFYEAYYGNNMLLITYNKKNFEPLKTTS